MKSFKKRIVLIFLCMVVSVSFVYQEIGNSKVYASEQEIQILSVEHKTSDNDIDITFKVQNNSTYVYKDLKYQARLYYKYDSSGANLIEVVTDDFYIGQNSLRTLKFKFNISEEMPKGNYFMMFDIQNASSMDIDFEYVDLDQIGKANNSLVFFQESLKIITKEGEVNPNSGPNFEKNVSPKLKLKVRNNFDRTMNVKPLVRMYQRSKSFNSSPVYEGFLPELSFGAKEEKEIELDIPSREIPESYYVQVELVENETTKVSGIIECRYVVFGASAKIVTHKSSMQNGELKMNVSIVGPADGSSIENTTVRVEVVNDDNKETFIKNEEIVHISNKITEVYFEEPFEYGAKNLIIKYSVIYEGEELASVEHPFKVEEIEIVFSDIEDYKFKQSIIELSRLGILNGYKDGTFRPTNGITRAEFSVIMCYLLGKEEEAKKTKILDDFVDVDSDHWAGGFIKVLKDDGLIKGYPNKTFKPSDKITYAEAITVIVKIINEGKALPEGSTWYGPFVDFASTNNITNNIAVKLHEYTVRGDVAEMVYKAYQLMNQ